VNVSYLSAKTVERDAQEGVLSGLQDRLTETDSQSPRAADWGFQSQFAKRPAED
jgi:hypothetical protein